MRTSYLPRLRVRSLDLNFYFEAENSIIEAREVLVLALDVLLLAFRLLHLFELLVLAHDVLPPCLPHEKQGEA